MLFRSLKSSPVVIVGPEKLRIEALCKKTEDYLTLTRVQPSPLLSSDVSTAVTAFKDSERDAIDKIMDITLSGNVAVLQEVIKTFGIQVNQLTQRSGFSLLQLAVLSGKVDMVQYLQQWMGDINKLKDQEPDDSSDDEALDVSGSEGNPFVNLNNLLHPAIMSKSPDMLDFVMKNFVNENMKKVSATFAQKCIKDAFATVDINIMQAVITNPFVTQRARSSDDQGNPYSRVNARVSEAMLEIFEKWKFDDIKWAYDNFYHYIRLVPDDIKKVPTDVYEVALERDDITRQKIRELISFALDQEYVSDFIKYKIQETKKIENLLQDSKQDPATMQFDDVGTPMSIADLAAKKGALDTLKKALVEWKVPVNETSLANPADKDKNQGLLRYAAQSGSAEVFRFTIKHVENELPKLDWSKVQWVDILKDALQSAKKCGNAKIVSAVLGCIKNVYTKLYNQADKHVEMFFDAIRLPNWNNPDCDLMGKYNFDLLQVLIIDYAIEQISLKPSIMKLQQFIDDVMTMAIRVRSLDVIQHLVEVHNVGLMNPRFVDELVNHWNISGALDDGNTNKPSNDPAKPSVLEYLIDHGMTLSLEQLQTLKQKCLQVKVETSYLATMSREEFQQTYGVIFDRVEEKLKKQPAPVVEAPSMLRK